MSTDHLQVQQFRGIGVVIRRERKGTQGKIGRGAVFEKTNGFKEVSGHFRGGENRAAGRLLRGPEGEEHYQGVEGRGGGERKKAILLYRATEHGV